MTTPEEIIRRARAGRNGDGPPGDHDADDPLDDGPRDCRICGAPTTAATCNGCDALLTGARNGEWLDQQTFPDLRFAVPRLIPEGLTFNIGGPKIGKSWFAASLGLAAAAGGVALGKLRVAQRPVFYAALEDGDRRLQARCRKLLCSRPLPKGFEYITQIRRNLVLPTIERWLIDHEHDEPLVILDTLGKVMPAALIGDTTYERDYRIGADLKGLADAYRGFVVVNHHDRKAGADDFVQTVSGTNGLAGSADTIMVLRRRRHEVEGTLSVTGRDVEEAEYAMTFRWDEAWQIAGDDLDAAAQEAETRRGTEGVGDLSARIVAYVARLPTGVTAADVEKVFGAGTRRYLARLEKSGRIAKVARGRYGSVPSVPSVPNRDPNGTHGTHGTHPRLTLVDDDDPEES